MTITYFTETHHALIIVKELLVKSCECVISLQDIFSTLKATTKTKPLLANVNVMRWTVML